MKNAQIRRRVTKVVQALIQALVAVIRALRFHLMDCNVWRKSTLSG
jgi:hypothetical protein